jgi:hypothetical protein
MSSKGITLDASFLRNIHFQLALIGGSIYFFIRYRRHEKMYSESLIV